MQLDIDSLIYEYVPHRIEQARLLAQPDLIRTRFARVFVADAVARFAGEVLPELKRIIVAWDKPTKGWKLEYHDQVVHHSSIGSLNTCLTSLIRRIYDDSPQAAREYLESQVCS